MSTLTRQVHVHDGRISLENLPFAENTQLTVILVPKFPVETAHFWEAQKITANLKSTISSESDREYDERVF